MPPNGTAVRLSSNELVRLSSRACDYPLQLMIDLFEFPATAAVALPTSRGVTAVRGYQPYDP